MGNGRGGSAPISREEFRHQLLNDVKQDLRAAKRHLDVDLRELRLAVGAQIFIAEAADDLKIAVEAAHHQDLLEQSAATAAARRTSSAMNAAGHQVIARALGGRAREERRFNLNELVRVMCSRTAIAARWRRRIFFCMRRAAQIEIAIAQPGFLGGAAVIVNGKRGSLRLIQKQAALLARTSIRPVGICGLTVSASAKHHFAFNADDEFGPHLLAFRVRLQASSRLHTICVKPVWSRRSRKMRLPRSRRRATQPARNTACP